MCFLCFFFPMVSSFSMFFLLFLFFLAFSFPDLSETKGEGLPMVHHLDERFQHLLRGRCRPGRSSDWRLPSCIKEATTEQDQKRISMFFQKAKKRVEIRFRHASTLSPGDMFCSFWPCTRSRKRCDCAAAITESSTLPRIGWPSHGCSECRGTTALDSKREIQLGS